MGHIDPSTGRNKRETGKLAKRFTRYDAAYASGSGRPKSGAIRMSAGKPAEKRVTWRRRVRLYPPGKRRR
jgi:hypothetical protein